MDAQSENAQLRAELAVKDARIGELEQQVAKLSGALASPSANGLDQLTPPSTTAALTTAITS